MDKVSLKIGVRDTNNNSKTINVSNINPNSDNTTLKQFAQKLNALSSNTFVSVEKVESIDITDAKPDTITFNVGMNFFTQDFWNESFAQYISQYTLRNTTTDVWVTSVSDEGDDITAEFYYTYRQTTSERVASDSKTYSADSNVFDITVNDLEIVYTLSEWLNFDSDSFITDLNSQLTDTSVSYSNGVLTFSNPNRLNITISDEYYSIISTWVEKAIIAECNGQLLPDGVVINQNQIIANFTDTGIFNLGTVNNPSPNFVVLTGEYSEDVQAKIDIVNNSLMPTIQQVFTGDSDVAVANLSEHQINTIAYYGSRNKITSPNTWNVYPIQFSAGNGEVKIDSSDLGISNSDWNNLAWIFIVTFNGNTPVVFSNSAIDINYIPNRLITSNVGNSTALIYTVQKAG